MSNMNVAAEKTIIPQVEVIWTMHFQQKVFRCILEAMSRPGTILELTDLPDGCFAHRAVLATLLDNEVTLSDHHKVLSAEDWPLLQAKKATSESADYVLCDATNTPDFQPKLGTLPSPDFAATLVLIVDKLGEDNKQPNPNPSLNLNLNGPGINGNVLTTIAGLNTQWLAYREQWNCAFPLGIDMIIIDNNQVMSLPRTTNVEDIS